MEKIENWIDLLLWTMFCGIADISKKFSTVLTVSGKFGYNCVYVFHVIVPSSQVWQKIISQTSIFNIFPASVLFNTVSKIIQSNCILQSKKYIPARSLWLNRVFSDLANSHEKHCLTIDCGYLNKNSPRSLMTYCMMQGKNKFCSFFSYTN